MNFDCENTIIRSSFICSWIMIVEKSPSMWVPLVNCGKKGNQSEKCRQIWGYLFHKFGVIRHGRPNSGSPGSYITNYSPTFPSTYHINCFSNSLHIFCFSSISSKACVGVAGTSNACLDSGEILIWCIFVNISVHGLGEGAMLTWRLAMKWEKEAEQGGASWLVLGFLPSAIAINSKGAPPLTHPAYLRPKFSQYWRHISWRRISYNIGVICYNKSMKKKQIK